MSVERSRVEKIHITSVNGCPDVALPEITVDQAWLDPTAFRSQGCKHSRNHVLNAPLLGLAELIPSSVQLEVDIDDMLQEFDEEY